MPTKSKTTKITTESTGSLGGLARLGYFYLITFLGLLTFAVGAVSLVNVLLESFVLPPTPGAYEISDAISQQIRNEYVPYSEESSKTQTITMEDAKRLVKQADQAVADYYVIPTSARNHALSLSIVLLFVGGGIYLWHRKEIFQKIQK